MRISLLCLALLTPATALGTSVSTDVTLGSVDLGEGERATYVGVNLSGNIDLLEDRLALDTGYSLLRDEGSALRHLFLLGLEYLPNDHWSVELLGTASPKRQSTYPLTQGVTGVTTDWNTGLALMGSYDTFGDSNLEAAIDAVVGVTRYSVVQTARSARLVRPLFSDQLTQLKAGAGVTGTFWQDTDVGLRFSLYRYDKEDPDDAGYRRLARLGVVVGTGMPLAPLRWDARASVSHRFGTVVSLTGQVGLGRYFDGERTSLATLKLSYRPIRSLRLFTSGTLQRDVAADAPAVLSRYANLGVEYRF